MTDSFDTLTHDVYDTLYSRFRAVDIREDLSLGKWTELRVSCQHGSEDVSSPHSSRFLRELCKADELSSSHRERYC